MRVVYGRAGEDSPILHAKISAAPWDEVLWMRTVMAQEVPWTLKQQLIQCRLLANQVATEPTVRQWFNDAWVAAQWKRIDAERTLMSPVRHDDHEYIRLRLEEALSQYQRLANDANTIDRAIDLCGNIRKDLRREVSRPILARSPKDDLICQLLSESVDLQAWIDRRQGDAIHRCEALATSIARRYRLIEERFHNASDDISTDSPATGVVGQSGRFVENTRIRIARSTYAIQLLRHENDRSALESLTEASDQALKVLSSSSSSQNEIVASTRSMIARAVDCGLRSLESMLVASSAQRKGAVLRSASLSSRAARSRSTSSIEGSSAPISAATPSSRWRRRARAAAEAVRKNL